MMFSIIGKIIYISKTYHCIYFLDENKELREIPLGIMGEVSSYAADVSTAKFSIIKGRKREPGHNRIVKNHLLYDCAKVER